jgi:K+-sensing histidine kinase KdpD
MSVVDAYLRMLQEAKKEPKLDPVNKKELEKDFDDREDGDIDNDGDTDKSDEYLHNKRKAVSKSMKGESIVIDPENGEVSKKKKSDKKDEKDNGEKVMAEAATEKLEPAAKGEKDFADLHKVDVALDVNDAIANNVNAAKAMKTAPKRPGDNAQGDKLKKFKDIRK